MEQNNIEIYSHFLERTDEIRSIITKKCFYEQAPHGFVQDEDWDTCLSGDGFLIKGEKLLYYNIADNCRKFLYTIDIPLRFIDDDGKIEEIIQNKIDEFNKENGYGD